MEKTEREEVRPPRRAEPKQRKTKQMRPPDDPAPAVPARLQKALDALVAAASPAPGQAGAKATATPPQQHQPNAPRPARPWDRGDLFRRLQTFRASTWFAKPPAAGPVPCARRGWCNTGPDMLTCEVRSGGIGDARPIGAPAARHQPPPFSRLSFFPTQKQTCRHKLHFPLPPDLPLDEVAAAASDFAARLVTSHRPDCAWRTGAPADPGALAFPPLPADEVVREWAARADSGLELDCLPGLEGVDAVAAAYPARLAALLERGVVEEEGTVGESVLPPGPPLPSLLAADRGSTTAAGLARSGSPAFHARRRLLALLGWTVRVVNPAAVKLRAAAAAAAADAAGAAAARATLAAGPDAPLPPLKLPPPPDPRAPVLPPGSLRACDALLACDMCGASVGLWSHVPPGACGGGGGGGGGSGGSAAHQPPPSLALATLGRRGSSLDGGGGGGGGRPRSASLDLLASTPLSAGRTIAGGLLESPGGGGGGADGTTAAGSPGPAASPAPAVPVFGLAAFRRRSLSAGGSPTPVPAPPPAKRTRTGLRSGGPPAPAAPAPTDPPAGPSPALLAATVGAATSAAWPPPGAGVAAEPLPLDPVAAHRRWCPWVHAAGRGGGGGGGGGGGSGPPPRTGWRYTLPLLVSVPGPEEELGRKVVEAAAAAAAADDDGEEDEADARGGGPGADPAARLRAAMLQAGL
jgi:hypothetical protein